MYVPGHVGTWSCMYLIMYVPGHVGTWSCTSTYSLPEKELPRNVSVEQRIFPPRQNLTTCMYKELIKSGYI